MQQFLGKEYKISVYYRKDEGKQKMKEKVKEFIVKNLKWIILFICLIGFLAIAEDVFNKEIMNGDIIGYKLISTFLISDFATPIAKFITNFGGAIFLAVLTIVLFILIKKEPVPVIIIEGLEENFIYHVFSNELGKLEKSVDEFEIIVKDFYNDNKLLKKVMLEKISGSELKGNDKKNYLLESVDLLIGEYIFYDNDKLVSVKFDH